MKISKQQLDDMSEVLNIGIGKSSKVLNSMLNSHINLQVPEIKVLNKDEFIDEISELSGDDLAAVDLAFTGYLEGIIQLIFPSDAAMKLVMALIGEEGEAYEFDEIRSGTLCEVGNIVLNAVMGTISNFFSFHLQYIIPNYREGSIENIIDINNVNSSTLLLAKTCFSIEAMEIEGNILLYFEENTITALLKALDAINEKLVEN